MELNDYQNRIKKFDLFKVSGTLDLAFLDKVLGLAGEAGEVADKVKKIIRDDGAVISEKAREDLQKELGDVLWYLATTARYLDLTLEEVAQANVVKLDSRLEREVIKGSGDDR